MRILKENGDIIMTNTRKQDLPFILEAERENSEFVGQWTIEQHEKALNDDDILHILIKKIDGRNIGYIILKGLASQNNSIELMRIVITEKNKGYGKIVISLIKKWCFEIRHTHRLWLDVRENNVKAQYVYENQGFKKEGILRECIKDGNSYQSLIVMSILSQEYKKV